jgi:radical SAM superfamily enzyme YgiQ (UPF0313 family)
MSNLRVALVQPNYQNKVFESLSIPLGLAWLSAYLKNNGFEVTCYDLALSPQSVKFLFNGEYDVMGFQLHSMESLKESLALNKKIKAKHPAIKTVVGGYAATFLWNELLDENFIDVAVIGEGEITMVELLKIISDYDPLELEKIKGIAFRDKNQKRFTGYRELIKNLDDIPFPDRESFDWKSYPQCSVITTRGCPYRCAFCTVPRFWQGKTRFRSPENVYKELCELEQNYHITRFFILDDSFSLIKSRVKKLMSAIIKGKHDFEWACLTRADCVDKEVLELFKKAGCTEISFGVESANQETLNFLNKDIEVSQIERTIKLTKKMGIRVRCSFIFGLPNETKDDVLNTIDFIVKTEPEEVQIYPLIPYPGTLIFQHPEEYGIKILSSDFSTWRKDAQNPIIETEHLSKKQITNLVRLCVERLKERGYVWIPGDKKPGKYLLEKCVMTEFNPIQALL